MKDKIKSSKAFNNLHVIIFSLIFAAVGGFIIIRSLAATPPAMYLTPASSTVPADTEFTVEVRVDSGTETLNGVTAKLSYDQNLLDFVSIDTSTGDFKLFTENSGSNGQISIIAAAFDASGNPQSYTTTGDKSVAKIKFKTKTTAGAANVNFVAGSQLIHPVSDEDSVDILGSIDNTSGGVYTIPAQTGNPKTSKIYLSPPTNSVNQNTEFNVAIVEDSGTTTVNGVTAVINYDPAMLDFVSIDTSTGAFKLFTDKMGSNGAVIVTAAAFDAAANPQSYALNGVQTIANVKFKSKTTNGLTALEFVNGTKLLDSTNSEDVLGTITGANITVSSGTTATPRSGGGGSVRPSPAPSPAPTPTPAPVTKPASSIKSTSASAGSGTLTKPANQNSEVAVNDSDQNTTPATSEDESSQTTYQDEALDEIVGYPIKIKVVNSKGTPLKGYKVTLDGKSKITDKNGQVIFDDVLPGNQKVIIGGKSYNIKVESNLSGSDIAQQITVKIKEDIPIWQYAIVGIAVVTVIVIATFITIQNGRGKIKPPKSMNPDEPKAVVMTK